MSGEPSAKRRKGNGPPKMSPVTPVEVISLLDSDDDDDDIIVADNSSDDIEIVPISAPVALSLQLGGTEFEEGDDDLQAVGVIQTAAVYAHARADCRAHVFAPDNTDAAHEKNQKCCDKCYCYVCDDEASKCNAWDSHCMASDKRTAWRNLRTKKKSKPAQPIDVPSLLLPPKLRATASRTPVSTYNASRLVQKSVTNFFGRPQSSSAKARAHMQSHINRRNELVEDAREKIKLQEQRLDEKRALFAEEAIPPAHKGMVFRKRTGSTSSNMLPPYIRVPASKKFLIGAIDFWRPYCSHRDATLPQDVTMDGVSLGFFELADWSGKSKATARVLARELGLGFWSSSFWASFSHVMYDRRTGYVNHKLEDKLRKLFPPHSDKALAMSVNADGEPIAEYVWENLQQAVQRGFMSVRWEVVHYSGSEGSNKENALSCCHQSLTPTELGDDRFFEVLKATSAWQKECKARLAGVGKLNNSNCCRLRAWVSLLPEAFSSSNVRVAADLADPSSPYAYHSPIDGGVPLKSAPAGEWGTGVSHYLGILGKVLTQLQFADFSRGPLTLSPQIFLSKSFETPLLQPSFRGVTTEDREISEKQEELYESPEALLPGGVGGQKLFSIEGILSSPIFTVSEGYAGGAAPQPSKMTVTLRPYQLETLQWMLDQEAKSSISDLFWVKLTMAPVVNSNIAQSSSASWEPFWYCPLTGAVSRLAPPKVVGGILSEEMGLGKTVEVISLLTETLDAARSVPMTGVGTPTSPLKCGTTLIITPVSLLQQWRAELTRRASPGSLNICLWYGSNRPKSPKEMAKFDVLLTTYSTMASKWSDDALQSLHFHRIVIDESTYVRGGANTSMYNCLMRIRSSRRWAVSGTPFANNIRTLLPIMRFLGVSPFAQERAFSPMVEEFNARLTQGYSRTRKPHGELPVMPTAALAFVLKSLMMRHCKRQELNGNVLVELPPSSGRMVKVELTASERIAYDRIETAAQASAMRYLRSDATVNRNIIVLRQELLPIRMATTGIVRSMQELRVGNGPLKKVYSTSPTPGAAKIAQLLKDIGEIRDNDPVAKFVIFTENDPLKQELKRALAAAGLGVSSLDGNMPAPQRGRILANMAEDPERIALLLSSNFAHGLNLIWANIIVFLEPSLSQETELQACDRVRRIGQTKQTTILTYVATGTIDERICEVRTMRGHPACTGESAPGPGGNENISHWLRFSTYLNLPCEGNGGGGGGGGIDSD